MLTFPLRHGLWSHLPRIFAPPFYIEDDAEYEDDDTDK